MNLRSRGCKKLYQGAQDRQADLHPRLRSSKARSMARLNTRYLILPKVPQIASKTARPGCATTTVLAIVPVIGIRATVDQRIQVAVLPISRGMLLRSNVPVYIRKPSRTTQRQLHAHSRKNSITPHLVD